MDPGQIYNTTNTTNAVIVDDHEMFRKGLKYLINEIQDIKVVGEVSNGFELLEFIKKQAVDLIFMDIKMPEMDGIEATRKVIQKYPDIKIIILTMYGYKQYYNKIIDAGAKAFLLKSAKIQEIRNAIQTVLKNEFYISHELTNNFTNEKNHDKLNIKFSKRELEILQFVCKGFSNKEIAEKLYISEKTIEWHKSNLLNKTNSKNSASLVAYAINNNLVDTEPDRLPLF